MVKGKVSGVGQFGELGVRWGAQSVPRFVGKSMRTMLNQIPWLQTNERRSCSNCEQTRSLRDAGQDDFGKRTKAEEKRMGKK